MLFESGENMIPSESKLLYTIGHSNHSLERFFELLWMHEELRLPA